MINFRHLLTEAKKYIISYRASKVANSIKSFQDSINDRNCDQVDDDMQEIKDIDGVTLVVEMNDDHILQ